MEMAHVQSCGPQVPLPPTADATARALAKSSLWHSPVANTQAQALLQPHWTSGPGTHSGAYLLPLGVEKALNVEVQKYGQSLSQPIILKTTLPIGDIHPVGSRGQHVTLESPAFELPSLRQRRTHFGASCLNSMRLSLFIQKMGVMTIGTSAWGCGEDRTRWFLPPHPAPAPRQDWAWSSQWLLGLFLLCRF